MLNSSCFNTSYSVVRAVVGDWSHTRKDMVAIGHVSRHHFAATVCSTVQLTFTAASGIAINNENSFHSCSVRLGFRTSKAAPSFENLKC